MDEASFPTLMRVVGPIVTFRLLSLVPGTGRTKASDMGATEALVKMVLFLTDRIKAFKLSQQVCSPQRRK